MLGSVHSCLASTGNDLGIFSIRGQNFDSVYREFCLHKSLNRLKNIWRQVNLIYFILSTILVSDMWFKVHWYEGGRKVLTPQTLPLDKRCYSKWKNVIGYAFQLFLSFLSFFLSAWLHAASVPPEKSFKFATKTVVKPTFIKGSYSLETFQLKSSETNLP